jgi:hypothetical protein
VNQEGGVGRVERDVVQSYHEIARLVDYDVSVRLQVLETGNFITVFTF